MTPEESYPSCQICIIGGEHASIAISAQILRRKKAKAATMAKRASSLTFVLGPQSLGSIFNNEEFPVSGNLENRIHIRHLSKEVDRDDGSRPLSQCCIELCRIKIISLRIDIDEYGPCPHAHDAAN